MLGWMVKVPYPPPRAGGQHRVYERAGVALTSEGRSLVSRQVGFSPIVVTVGLRSAESLRLVDAFEGPRPGETRQACPLPASRPRWHPGSRSHGPTAAPSNQTPKQTAYRLKWRFARTNQVSNVLEIRTHASPPPGLGSRR